jgi:hypothetical protein
VTDLQLGDRVSGEAVQGRITIEGTLDETELGYPVIWSRGLAWVVFEESLKPAPVAEATPEDVAEVEARHGQTMEQLVAEAERGYDLGYDWTWERAAGYEQ